MPTLQTQTAEKQSEPAINPHHYEQGEHHFEWIEFARIALVGVGAGVNWFGIAPAFHGFDVFAITVLLIGGYPVFEEALSNLAARRMTMELSMTIALVAATAIREFFTALIILLFVLIAELLEEFTVDRGRRAIQLLLDLLPKRATIRRGNAQAEVSITEVASGDIVIVKPGAEIPVDGSVVQGHSFVNQASITGESMAVEKIGGAKVFAGTTNLNGSLEIETVQVGRDTIFGKIIEAVERAEHSRAPIQKLADRLAGYLVYFAMGAAVITYLLTHNMRSTIAVIIVAGACGIAAGTPLAVLGAIGLAARRGAIIKGGRYLEMLGEIDTVVLDKTGTLTFGDPEVTGLCPARGSTEQVLIEAAVLAERLSEHPLAKAILKRASRLSVAAAEPDSFEYLPGKGVRCSIFGDQILAGNQALLNENGVPVIELDVTHFAETRVFVSRCGMLLGSIHIEDKLRPEAVAAVRALKDMGLRVVLLTGDTSEIANSVGRQLAVDEVVAELLPDQKQERISQMQAAGSLVAMVGDGINDAPALATAAVGVAMASGTDIARQSADVLLIGNNLLDFVETLRTARRCRRIIFTNFVGTLIVDAIGVVLAAVGVLNPLLAAFIHVSSELTFIGNSARLVPASQKTRLAREARTCNRNEPPRFAGAQNVCR